MQFKINKEEIVIYPSNYNKYKLNNEEFLMVVLIIVKFYILIDPNCYA